MSKFAKRRVLRVSIDGEEFTFRPISLRRCLADNLLDPAVYMQSIATETGLDVTARERVVARIGDERALETVMICDASISPKIVPTDPGSDADEVWIELFNEVQRAKLLSELAQFSRMNAGDVEVIAPFRDTSDTDDTGGTAEHDTGSAG